MEEQYDVIILGTGIKECILSGLLSCDGKKVLHIDKNSYYGGETASLNLKELYSAYKPGAEVRTDLGDHRDFIVDLCPKFLMACGYSINIFLNKNKKYEIYHLQVFSSTFDHLKPIFRQFFKSL